MVFLQYSRFGNKNLFGRLGYFSKDSNGEVATKQQAAVVDVILGTHENLAISLVAHKIH